MKHIELNGQVREAGNKAAVKAIRREGQVPCNIYGLGLENILFTIDAQDLKTITHTPNSFIIDLKLSDGRSGGALCIKQDVIAAIEHTICTFLHIECH